MIGFQKKIHTLLIFCMVLILRPDVFGENLCFASAPKKEEVIFEDKTRQLMSEIRGGDFSHIGGVSAITALTEVMLSNDCSSSKEENTLEIGCGFGGTASFMHSSGYSNIWGLDIEKNVIESARAKYPEINFINTDATEITDDFESDFFSFVFMINTAYSIKDQNALWQNVKKVSKKGATLAVLDYNLGSALAEGEEIEFTKFNGKPFYPINLEDTKKVFNYIGWDIIKIEDITEDFKIWHQELLAEIENKQVLLESGGYTEEQISFTYDNITNTIRLLEEGKLGGSIIIARKR